MEKTLNLSAVARALRLERATIATWYALLDCPDGKAQRGKSIPLSESTVFKLWMYKRLRDLKLAPELVEAAVRVSDLKARAYWIGLNPEDSSTRLLATPDVHWGTEDPPEFLILVNLHTHQYVFRERLNALYAKTKKFL